jgi:hypothetical protein
MTSVRGKEGFLIVFLIFLVFFVQARSTLEFRRYTKTPTLFCGESDATLSDRAGF